MLVWICSYSIVKLLIWNTYYCADDELRLQVLHTYKGNKSAEKALIAAEYVGVQIDVPSDFQMGVTNKTPAFLKMNPIGKVCHHWCLLNFWTEYY